ncbi:MAG: hypothetical protein QNJ22_10100 [Desulfosarcinaceae bacterium]|nr:hypothetical protein [Desulfosarcinaceae bacterium]
MRLFSPKSDGLIALFLIGLALSAVVGYSLWSPWQQRQSAGTRPLPALPDIAVPDEAVQQEMAALNQRLNRLAYPHAVGAKGPELGLFGYIPVATGYRRDDAGRSGVVSAPVQFDYTLSFALAAGSRRLCLLDGELFAQGAELPDGGRILAIEPERVLIEKTPLKRWIYLQEPPLGRDASPEARGPVAPTHEEL